MTVNRPASDVRQHPATVPIVCDGDDADDDNGGPSRISTGPPFPLPPIVPCHILRPKPGTFQHIGQHAQPANPKTYAPQDKRMKAPGSPPLPLPRLKTTDVEAIEDHQAILYCPLLASNRDKINMVLWFRDNAGIPLYRADRGPEGADRLRRRRRLGAKSRDANGTATSANGRDFSATVHYSTCQLTWVALQPIRTIKEPQLKTEQQLLQIESDRPVARQSTQNASQKRHPGFTCHGSNFRPRPVFPTKPLRKLAAPALVRTVIKTVTLNLSLNR
uniref:Ig-like domain-containing protein n=1 Tax=Anopheles atroparvus TaxID=41427 RepID=A0A182JL14_ANOAO